MSMCNRRTFMKTSLAAVGSVTLASRAWSQIRGANDDIRVAMAIPGIPVEIKVLV